MTTAVDSNGIVFGGDPRFLVGCATGEAPGGRAARPVPPPGPTLTRWSFNGWGRSEVGRARREPEGRRQVILWFVVVLVGSASAFALARASASMSPR